MKPELLENIILYFVGTGVIVMGLISLPYSVRILVLLLPIQPILSVIMGFVTVLLVGGSISAVAISRMVRIAHS